MKHFTKLNRKEIESIVANFGISTVTTFKLLQGGSANTNYLVRSPKAKYVLSICEQKSIKATTKLAKLLRYLKKKDFKTSKLIPTASNELIYVWNKKTVLLKKYIKGTIQEDLSSQLLSLIGQQLAQLHQIKAPKYLPQTLSYGKENFNLIKAYAANSKFDKWLQKVLVLIEPYHDSKLPKALIHSDLFWNNVIIRKKQQTITIMDFEEAAHYYRVYDIGMAIIGLCATSKKINFKKVRHFLNGYHTESPLSAQEIKALKAFTIYAGASMTFWRHRNFNYVIPTPNLFKHYKGLKVLVDYIWKQEEDCFSRLL